MQFYTDESREADPTALPNAETFKGYDHECPECEAYVALFPDYYGLLYPAEESCLECGHGGLRCTDTVVKWFWWPCFPGCLPDGDPIGPFATEDEAIEDARA